MRGSTLGIGCKPLAHLPFFARRFRCMKGIRGSMGHFGFLRDHRPHTHGTAPTQQIESRSPCRTSRTHWRTFEVIAAKSGRKTDRIYTLSKVLAVRRNSGRSKRPFPNTIRGGHHGQNECIESGICQCSWAFVFLHQAQPAHDLFGGELFRWNAEAKFEGVVSHTHSMRPSRRTRRRCQVFGSWGGISHVNFCVDVGFWQWWWSEEHAAEREGS